MHAQLQIRVASPNGFCAGVDRAIDIVLQLLDKYKAPIYVKHEIVHNRMVCDELSAKGVVFIENLADVPEGSIVVFSAHGVSQSIRQEAKQRKLRTYDATCPLVTKVHVELVRLIDKGYQVILIGHANHPEVEGIIGQTEQKVYLVETVNDLAGIKAQVGVSNDKIAYLTQTTLSQTDTADIVHKLKKMYPNIVGPTKSDICYATQNRQNAVAQLAPKCDVFVVVGSANSSNSNRLVEIVQRKGIPVYLLDDPRMLNSAMFAETKVIGVSAGASAPRKLIDQVISTINAMTTGQAEVKIETGVTENIVFSLPSDLRKRSNVQ